jgi:hypothetical protein
MINTKGQEDSITTFTHFLLGTPGGDKPQHKA